jgi:hypothetical protein
MRELPYTTPIAYADPDAANSAAAADVAANQADLERQYILTVPGAYDLPSSGTCSGPEPQQPLIAPAPAVVPAEPVAPSAPEAATVETPAAVAVPAAATVTSPEAATVPAAVPAGDGGSAPSEPIGLYMLLGAAALGAAVSGLRLARTSQ